MASQCLNFALNAFGLVLNTAGAFTIFYYGEPPLRVTEHGANLDVWAATPSEPQRLQNEARYRTHRHRSRIGLILLASGFIAQLGALAVTRWNGGW